MNSYAKSCICGYVMFLCKIDELMKLRLLNYEWIRDYLLLMMSWNMLLMNGVMSMPIGELMMKFVVVEYLWNDVLILSFVHHWVCFHVYDL